MAFKLYIACRGTDKPSKLGFEQQGPNGGFSNLEEIFQFLSGRNHSLATAQLYSAGKILTLNKTKDPANFDIVYESLYEDSNNITIEGETRCYYIDQSNPEDGDNINFAEFSTARDRWIKDKGIQDNSVTNRLKFQNSLKRLATNIFKHPGSWVLAALIAVAIAFAAPVAAPALIIFAGLAIAIAAPIALAFQAKNYWYTLLEEGKLPINNHGFQFAVGTFGVALFFVALLFTIGFFTGGGALAMVGGAVVVTGGGVMAPIFAALAAPFAAAATSLGIPLFLPALTGFCLVIAPLNLANTLKRFLAWLDSFKYDGVMAYGKKGTEPGDIEKVNIDDKEALRRCVEEAIKDPTHGYYATIFKGLAAAAENSFSSPFEEHLARDGYEKIK